MSRHPPGWQAHVRKRLCAREWVLLRDLFEAVANDIPLHIAYRANSRSWGSNSDASIATARWRTFKLYLYYLKVITDPPLRDNSGRQNYDYVGTWVALPPAPNTVCGRCAGASLVMCGGLVYCRQCRHTFSPRPAQRMAEANRKFWQQMRDRDASPVPRFGRRRSTE